MSSRSSSSIDVARHPDFVTHKYYLEFLASASKGLILNYPKKLPQSTKLAVGSFRDRKTLVKLTYQNLVEEHKSTQDFPDYARVCCAWVAIKSYYLIFHLETILISLINDDQSLLKISHKKLKDEIVAMVNSKDIQTNSKFFSAVYKNSQVANFKVLPQDNIRPLTSDVNRYKGIMKKLYLYAIETAKQQAKDKRQITKNFQGEPKRKFNSSQIALLDFFLLV